MASKRTRKGAPRMLVATVTAMLVTALLPAHALAADGAMSRLYNPNSGEHFYTASLGECISLMDAGWSYEGIGWHAGATGDPVYRLYNANGGEHHFTLSATERDHLVSVGWSYEGVGWRSAGSAPVYRLYNPNEFANNHHYTTSAAERDWLVSLGWRDEGIAWYGLTWVVDSHAWNEQVLVSEAYDYHVTETREISRCSDCHADITGDPWGHIDAFHMHEDENGVYHPDKHCGWYSDVIAVETGEVVHYDAVYKTVYHAETGHWE